MEKSHKFLPSGVFQYVEMIVSVDVQKNVTFTVMQRNFRLNSTVVNKTPVFQRN